MNELEQMKKDIKELKELVGYIYERVFEKELEEARKELESEE